MKAIRKPLFILAATVFAALMIAIATQAQAQFACAPRDSIIEKLKMYGETRHGGGLAGSTAIFEIWVSEATGTWTILTTTPDGETCVMAVGDSWQDDAGGTTPTGDPI